jgi:putative DeoR family transcriptional regulator (stage III sporulation protein D)
MAQKYFRSMVTSLNDRAVMYGMHIIKHKATVRDTAKYYGVGKSGVHTAVTEHLKAIDPSLYKRVDKILQYNKEQSHYRGGAVIRQRYKDLKSNS